MRNHCVENGCYHLKSSRAQKAEIVTIQEFVRISPLFSHSYFLGCLIRSDSIMTPKKILILGVG